ncbi:MAG TPA: FGGY family carbohydrate kinase [Silvibacterium sp.]|nr:FGGY family carbohydrate kinase [Silvibacterium sp.]
MPGSDPPNLVAIDLGAESCRVSLLQWTRHTPHIEVIHRFSNAPLTVGEELRWNFSRILSGIEDGLTRCAQKTSAPISAIGVDGWAVDYVRLTENGLPLAQPFCYRDTRTEAVEAELMQRLSVEDLFALSGAQPLRINSLYQLMADEAAGIPTEARWVNLPEYVLARLGGRIVAEFTNATHTGLVDIATRNWCPQIFDLCGLSLQAAPELVLTGSQIGNIEGSLRGLPAFHETHLIAPACHDTASAVAGIPIDGDDWAYISSGTWSLVGALLDHPIKTAAACAAGFTNLGAAGDCICFHKNVNGMWLLKQTLHQLCPIDNPWPMPELIMAAEQLDPPQGLLDVDDPALLAQGDMPSRINAQLKRRGLTPIEEHPSSMPRFASLIFHSLAHRYAMVLAGVGELTGKRLKRLAIVGGGSLNQFLNRLTAEATGLELCRGAVESSTIGNFAIQLAALEGATNSRSRIAHWAKLLTLPDHC